MSITDLIFNEGYTANTGPDLRSIELTREAIQLTRVACRFLPDEARSPVLSPHAAHRCPTSARVCPDGAPIPLKEQAERYGTRS